ncbi:hypothetical protein, partial [Bacillus sp. II_CA]|uniref:hypothetical protein n=1 Tax=Bacillus sp. II_CA TaxID=3417451 RepID=UPI003CE8BB01
MYAIDGSDAWAYVARNRFAQWENNIDRFSHAPLSVYHNPKFLIGNDSSFFCIGSCFARNIEELLIY